MPKLADDPQTENAKKRLEEERKVSDKSRAEYARLSKGRPTPTQEENDLAMLGAHILEHDPDGSDPDQNVPEAKHESHSGGARPYQTPRHSSSKE